MGKRITIFLENEDLEFLKPLVEKNKGNVSAAVREAIRSWREEKESIRDNLITKELAVILPMPFFIWFIRETRDRKYPPELCIQPIKRYSNVLNFDIKDLKNSEKYNKFLKIMGYPARVSISYSGEEELTLTFEGHSSDILDFLVKFTSSLYSMPPFNLRLVGKKESPIMVTLYFRR